MPTMVVPAVKFSDLSTAITRQFQLIQMYGLYRVQIDKQLLWDTYLASFPAGTNPIFKERTEHDCQCCKSFIRAIGGLAAIQGGKVVSLWDIEVEGFYQPVVDAMSALVKSFPIDNVLLHTEKNVGVIKTLSMGQDGLVAWDHFFLQLPAQYVIRGADIGPKLADFRSTKDVMLRSLKEITNDSIDTVLDLIGQNSLYRGEENKFAVTEFRKLKVEFNRLALHRSTEASCQTAQDIFCWDRVKDVPQSVSRIRNTSIGTLLVDLSEGMDIDQAVASFEAKVAPTNYKRPTALITKAMIEKAQAKIEELGLTSALERRYATIEDITINNIMFADRSAKKAMGNVFEELAAATPEKAKNLDKVEEVTIQNFIEKILPKAESLEVMFENRHAGSLVSLIAPAHADSKNMFKWPNGFSWSYTGELTDSIKERVKLAGGRVDGVFRSSLSWANYDDLDLHLTEPSGNMIYYGSKISTTGGQLDVDMNAGGPRSRTPVENIFYGNRNQMKPGLYRLEVNNYCQRDTTNPGFDVEMEFDGTVFSFSYPKAVKNKETIVIADFKYSVKDGVEIIKSLPSSQTSRVMWGVPTQTFHKVNVVMLSPNHWDEKAVGNRHYFFMLDGCLNEGKARGFFNEFLTAELDQHRKVFEVVGSKMKTDESDRQLSGLGFSSTQRNHLMCRVKGSFNRVVKIVF